MKFFDFRQNNSGGTFHFDEKKGITHFVIIEAAHAEDAVSKAEAIGLYFNGHGDCECCGERWSDDVDAADEPMLYGEPARDYPATGTTWMPKGKEIVVHYADGRKEWF